MKQKMTRKLWWASFTQQSTHFNKIDSVNQRLRNFQPIGLVYSSSRRLIAFHRSCSQQRRRSVTFARSILLLLHFAGRKSSQVVGLGATKTQRSRLFRLKKPNNPRRKFYLTSDPTIYTKIQRAPSYFSKLGRSKKRVLTIWLNPTANLSHPH